MDVQNAIFDERLQDTNVEDAGFLFGKGWIVKFKDVHVHIFREISFEMTRASSNTISVPIYEIV
jgi:hypothetical protein